ncbi:MAG: UDP-diphosphatase, partial [Bifidobacteriaceae bacterium]|nr:UDP-diphosphatase [Bifidobacteriaceae bacterium]
MHLWEALVLGLVQGLTEFLPISSSAHIRILGEFLPSAADPGAAFTAIIQIGTELAVLIYFRREVWAIAKSWVLSWAHWG